MPKQNRTDISSLRYVLYARKSTEDENRQVRSIDDQIRDCLKLADELGLHVVVTIKESKSAKKPNQRPLFTKMLHDIEVGKYDAILCWHPDRICRNMLEGGQIINMLDEAVLKDIRFHSHQFSNDANGKMLLGMLFVFSKQYSDDLSAKVNRGVTGNFEEGKSSGTPKLGYTRNDITGYYEPNEFYEVVKEAWGMRSGGGTIDAVASYLVENGVHRVTKDPKRQRIVRPTRNTVGKMFQDPFFYGTLIQASQTIDLCELTNFKPMVSKETYDSIQLLSYTRTKDAKPSKRAAFYPLRRFVFCGICNGPKPMLVGKNKSGSGKHVLSYRCDNIGCTRSPKSLRARNIFESIYSTLDQLRFSDEAYSYYSSEIKDRTDTEIVQLKQDLHSKTGALAQLVGEIERRATNIGLVAKSSPAYRPNMDLLMVQADQRVGIESEINEIKEKISNSTKAKLGQSEFLNLLKTMHDKMRAGSAVEKDVLCRILFLNLRVDNEKVVSYLWREPFASLMMTSETLSGGDERT